MSAILREYATATAAGTHIRMPMLLFSSRNFATGGDWTPVATDVKVSIDGAGAVDIGTLPSYSEGSWTFQLTAAEMTGKTIEIQIVDEATKAVKDQFVIIETYGNPLAMYATTGNNADVISVSSVFLREYSTATVAGKTIRIPILEAGIDDFATDSDWSPVLSDIQVSIDGGPQTDIGTVPVYTNGAWEFTFTAAELTGKTIEVAVVDAATKAVDDVMIIIETFGSPSAMFPGAFGAQTNVDIANRALTMIGEQTINSINDDTKRARAVNTIFTDVRESLLEMHGWKSARKFATLTQDTTYEVDDASWAASVTTITTKTDHVIDVGDTVTIAGFTETALNGDFVVAATPASNTFTYALTTDPTPITDPDTLAVTPTVLDPLTPNWMFSRQFSLPADFIRLIVKDEEANNYEIHGSAVVTDETGVKIEYVYKLTDPSEMSPSLREAFAAKLALELSYRLDTSIQKRRELQDNLDRIMSRARHIDASQRPDDAQTTDTWLRGRLSNGTLFRRISTVSS